MCVYCHDLIRSHAINEETKKTMLFVMRVLQRQVDGSWYRSSVGKGRQAWGLFALCLVCFLRLSCFLLLSCFSLLVCFHLFSAFICGWLSALVSLLLENSTDDDRPVQQTRENFTLVVFLRISSHYAVPWLSLVGVRVGNDVWKKSAVTAVSKD